MRAEAIILAGMMTAWPLCGWAEDAVSLRPLSELLPPAATMSDTAREGARRSLLQRGPGAFVLVDGRKIPFVYDSLLPDAVDLAMTCRAILARGGPAPGLTDAAILIARENLPATLVATTEAIVSVGVEERVAPLPDAAGCRAAMALLVAR